MLCVKLAEIITQCTHVALTTIYVTVQFNGDSLLGGRLLPFSPQRVVQFRSGLLRRVAL